MSYPDHAMLEVLVVLVFPVVVAAFDGVFAMYLVVIGLVIITFVFRVSHDEIEDLISLALLSIEIGLLGFGAGFLSAHTFGRACSAVRVSFILQAKV